jgi:hypothetical protein
MFVLYQSVSMSYSLADIIYSSNVEPSQGGFTTYIEIYLVF